MLNQAEQITKKTQYGYESASDRIADQTARIAGQIDRLGTILGPLLENSVAAINNQKEGIPAPGYSCEMLQTLNDRADVLAALSVNLEAFIQRIRL